MNKLETTLDLKHFMDLVAEDSGLPLESLSCRMIKGQYPDTQTPAYGLVFFNKETPKKTIMVAPISTQLREILAGENASFNMPKMPINFSAWPVKNWRWKKINVLPPFGNEGGFFRGKYAIHSHQ